MVIAVSLLARSDRKGPFFAAILVLPFGDIDCAEGYIPMELQNLGIASLAMAEADALLGITEQELDLEVCFIVTHDVPSAQFKIGAENDAGARGWDGIEGYGEALTAMIQRTREATQASIILLTTNMMPTRENDNVPRNTETSSIASSASKTAGCWPPTPKRTANRREV